MCRSSSVQPALCHDDSRTPEVILTTRTMQQVEQAVANLATEFAQRRTERAARTELSEQDFRRLHEAGFGLTGVPASRGGLWRGLPESVRGYCNLLRVLGRADASVALVAAMHPSVLAFWLAAIDADTRDEPLRAQAERNFDSARQGHWWGTVISEPGSGGDPMRSNASAVADGPAWRLSGAKHFASGAGITSFMITTAKCAGDSLPNLYTIDMRGRAWDGSDGMKLTRSWDGHGMIATQSHAFELDACPAERAAAENLFLASAPIVGQLTPLLFAAVILGILDSATQLARTAVSGRIKSLRAYEQVTWTQASNEVWLAEQAFEGALRSVESSDRGLLAAARAKLTIAELAESSLAAMARVIGGGSFSRSQPFGQWGQDVRALGFLRPPWGYAYDQLLGFEFD